jgi:hypothetical protein
MRSLLAMALFLFGISDLRAQPLPPDLASVPNDAFFVGHIKIADLWKNDALKEYRAILEKAGDQAIQAFEKRFSPSLSTIDRLTIYMPVPNFQERFEPSFVFIVALKQPVDKAKFMKQVSSSLEEKMGRLASFYADSDEGIAIRFIDDKTIAFGNDASISHMCDNAPPQAAGPLSKALALALTKRPVLFGFNAAGIPPEALEQGLMREFPEQFHPLFKAQSALLSLDLDGDGHLHGEIDYGDKAKADEAEKALTFAMAHLKGMIDDSRKMLSEKVNGNGKEATFSDLPEAAASLYGLGALKHAENILDSKPIKRNGTVYSATVPLPPQFKSLVGVAALAGSAMAPTISQAQASAARSRSMNNLKQIGLAMHNYHDTYNTLPPAAIVDKKGKPMLSWRVMILPYIEQDNLYKQFKLDEPWDSDHNKKLIDKMPPTYAIPTKAAKPGMTHYRVFVGNGAMFDWVQGSGFNTITDGLSNTWMVVEAEEGVPWTKPDDLEFDPLKELPKMGKFFKGGFNVVMGDGSVRFFKKVPDSAKASITKSGGEVIPNE